MAQPHRVSDKYADFEGLRQQAIALRRAGLSRRQIRDRLHGIVGAEQPDFNKTTLKKHNPRTVRKNVGDFYRGRLAIKVLKSADLYRRIEGTWYGIVGAAPAADLENRT